MKILHLIIDHQVIERALSLYEQTFPYCNEVLIFGNNNQYKHLTIHADCELVTSHNYEYIAGKVDFSEIKYVVVHYLTFEMIDFIRCIPQNISVCWEIYGYDLYNQFLESLGMELYYTSPNKYGSYPYLRLYFPSLFAYLLELKGCKHRKKSSIKKEFDYIVNRIDCAAACCKGDFQLLNSYAGKDIPGFLFCNYSLKETLGDLWGNPFSTGKRVLVGNSASYSNNHLYVLSYLDKYYKENDLALLMSLSYGGSIKYRDEVIGKFKEKYNNIQFLLDYMPLHEYNRIFLDLNAMILSAWRQESIGTIMMGLYLGIKIYMSEKSPLYQSFIDWGFKVFTVEGKDLLHIQDPLSIEHRIHNRELLLNVFDEKMIVKNLKENFCL